MQPHVKFCGMTREEDIRAAEDLGAEYIGFVFAESSPRHVTLEQAKKLRPVARRSKLVGVFVEDDPNAINAAAEALDLDYVQLHGMPDLELCTKINVPVIQAFHGIPPVHEIECFLEKCPYVLIDKEEGAESIDLKAVAALPASVKSRLFLAGGLKPENVKEAVALIRPFAVDCARGVEKRPGEKDRNLMHAFMAQISSIPASN